MSYIGAGAKEKIVARRGYDGLGLSLSDMWNAAKSGVNLWGESKVAEGKAAAATNIAKSQTNWVLPALIGAGVLTFVLLRRK